MQQIRQDRMDVSRSSSVPGALVKTRAVMVGTDGRAREPFCIETDRVALALRWENERISCVKRGKSNHPVAIFRLRRNQQRCRCFFFARCFIRLIAIERGEREPISALRTIRHSFIRDKWKKTLPWERAFIHLFTHSLTHRFLLFIINPVKVFHACAQSKSNLPLDSCRRLRRLVSLDVRNNTIIDEGKREKSGLSSSSSSSSFVNRKS